MTASIFIKPNYFATAPCVTTNNTQWFNPMSYIEPFPINSHAGASAQKTMKQGSVSSFFASF
jgi:hypothetical protein